jgi:pSer/pThr/pTyr-binding forkhead associated (FHA) protein
MGNAGQVRCWIRLGAHDIELRIGETLIGRHDSCHVVLDDALASRRHAALRFDGKSVLIEDLGSVNGVLVNGKRIRNSQTLVDGDEIKLGNQQLSIQLGASAGARPSRNKVGATTMARVPEPPSGNFDEMTLVRDAATLGVLANAGSKALLLGNGEHAEALVSKSLLTMMEHVRLGRNVDHDTMETAACQALKLAQATRKASWLDYTVSLYSISDRVTPGTVVELLYETVKQTPDFEIDALRVYVARLTSRQESMPPAERFLVRRLEGLVSRLLK